MLALRILRLLLFALVLALVAAVAIFMPGVPAVIVLDANVESLRFRPNVPELTRIRLSGYSISFEAPVAGLDFGDPARAPRRTASPTLLCLSGLVTPLPGTTMLYERQGDGSVAIEFSREGRQPAAIFEVGNRPLPEGLAQSSWLRLQGSVKGEDGKKPAGACPGEELGHLPLHGQAEIGAELRPLAAGERSGLGTLIEGSVDVHARTIRVPYLATEPRLYPAGISGMSIPPGSRLSLGPADEGFWNGIVSVAGISSGLQVRASSEATRIRIFRPGGGLEPEFISTSLFAPLTNDPLLVQGQLAIALLLSIYGFLSGWLPGRAGREPEE